MPKPKRTPKTVHALADCSYLPPGATTFEPCIDEVEIPVATIEHCTHEDTICPDCAWQWRLDHLFCATLPWEHDH